MNISFHALVVQTPYRKRLVVSKSSFSWLQITLIILFEVWVGGQNLFILSALLTNHNEKKYSIHNEILKIPVDLML